MKFLQLIRIAFFRDTFRRILLSAELIVGLIFLFLCISMLVKNQKIEQYYEKYSDMAAIELNNAEQQAYAEAHGILFSPSMQLQMEQQTGKNRSAEINSLDYYEAVPLELLAGSWLSDEDHGCTFNAVVPYSLRKQYSVGNSYEMSFSNCGAVSVYICGILDSDITFGNNSEVGFYDSNCWMLFCLAKGAEDPVRRPVYRHHYVKLTEIEPDSLRALGIEAVCLRKDALSQGNRQEMAVPYFLTLVLFVLFTTALIGDHFLSAGENEKTFAIYFLCGAGTRKAVLLQVGVNIAEILIPYLISLVAAWLIPIRLYPLGVLGTLLILLAGSALLSFVQMIRLRRESPSQIIARRFRG